MGQMVKNLPAMQETQVPSLCWDDPIEEGMATHSGILGWIISWTEESGRLQSMRPQRVGHDLVTKQQHGVCYYHLLSQYLFFFFLFCCTVRLVGS